MATTHIQFTIPPPLYRLNGGTVRALAGGEIYECLFHLVDAPGASAQVDGSTVEQLGDVWGVLHNTRVTVTLPGQREIFTGPGEMPDPQLVATRVVNRVIDHYRVIVEPTLRRVPPELTGRFHFRIEGDGEPFEGLVSGGSSWLDPAATVSASAPPGDESLIRFLNTLERGEQPEYRLMWADARASERVGDVRSAFAHLYMGLEMVLWITLEHLAQQDDRRATYEQEAFRADGSPSGVFEVLRLCNQWHPEPKSRTSLDKTANRFWKYRNDVLHGRRLVVGPNELRQAFADFEELAVWLDIDRSVLAGSPEAGGGR